MNSFEEYRNVDSHHFLLLQLQSNTSYNFMISVNNVATIFGRIVDNLAKKRMLVMVMCKLRQCSN
jgi:hypothetical protein